MQVIKLLFSKEWWGVRIVRVNQSLSKPFTLLMVIAFIILCVFLYFVIDNKRIIRETNTAATESAAAAVAAKNASENSEIIIANQQRDIETVKSELASLKRFSACLLALHDAGELASGDVEAQCDRMAANVELNDVTRAQPSTPTQSSTQAPSPGNSQGNGNSENTPPATTPDNEGVIVDLPLLPRIHIPSPF